MRNLNFKIGFTLVEVLVFISIFSLFFIAASSISLIILSNLKTQEHKILAAKYAQDLLEWLKSEKEADWLNFISKSSLTGKEYCFASTNIVNWPNEGSCLNFDGLNPPIYKRNLKLTKNNEETSVTVEITISWFENNKLYEIPTKTIFSIWE